MVVRPFKNSSNKKCFLNSTLQLVYAMGGILIEYCKSRLESLNNEKLSYSSMMNNSDNKLTIEQKTLCTKNIGKVELQLKVVLNLQYFLENYSNANVSDEDFQICVTKLYDDIIKLHPNMSKTSQEDSEEALTFILELLNAEGPVQFKSTDQQITTKPYINTFMKLPLLPQVASRWQTLTLQDLVRYESTSLQYRPFKSTLELTSTRTFYPILSKQSSNTRSNYYIHATFIDSEIRKN